MSDAMPETEPERWLPVVGYEGYYEVSDQGRVKSLHRRTLKRWPNGLILAGSLNHGYPSVTLYANGSSQTFQVHRLIMEAFVGPLPKGWDTRHLDGVRAHSVLSNLKYGPRTENAQDTLRHGHNANANKTHCPENHKFTPDNTYIRPDGGRECKICRTDRVVAWQERQATAGKRCTHPDGCEEPQAARGLCKSHWGKKRYAERMATAEPCTKDDCGKPQFSGGLCNGHYKKRLRSNA